MLLSCAGWGCQRTIRAVTGPLRRAEHRICPDCHGTLCAVCAGARPRALFTGPRCPACDGHLVNGARARRVLKSPKAELVRRFEQALRAGQCGQYAESLAGLDAVLAQRATFLAAGFHRGIALRELGRLDEALAAFEWTTRFDPAHLRAYFDQGNTLRDLGRPEEAVIVYDRVLAREPRYFAVLVNKATTLNELGLYEQSLAAATEAVRLDAEGTAVDDTAPVRGHAHGVLGAALTNLGRYEDALAAFDLALSTGPDTPDLHATRALVLARLGRV
ncbi:tetratricopeptide (TPR) repeat protein [Crossiella equi]|uniref:Tetratricopeptide (TPR) repeat protein n=1 Tax=Crossiella equi TaxID=130796 RepID=A0ABS5A3R0_9PSEU|nr:tetratricopeptide repeat protein [Crossiella equi]MBP2471216.1 tetratricopeptide (TPR) repeat protein [Crossiella equi]